jgi:lipopolysaccharide export system protein LptA
MRRYNQATPPSSKIRAFMKTTACFLMLTAALLALPAAAEKTDRDMPMNAESDSLRYDDLKQTSVFIGNVVITKGTIIIRGARVDVKQDAEGYQSAIVIAPPDKLAYYRKKRDGVDEYIEGEGERIEYDSRADTVKFIKRAVLRRYVGATLADETTGELIVYDNPTDVFTVDSGALNRTAANPSGRVRALLAPRNRLPTSAPLPAAPVPGAPALKSSPALGNEKK